MTELAGTDVLAEVIRQNYDLGEVSTPEPVPGAHQRRHRKLIVRTSRGTFLVKTYKRDPVILDALRFQHRLSEHLMDNGLPVARIQPTKSGRRIFEAPNWALELQQYVPGEAMPVTAQTLAVSSQALGRFHEVCRKFPRPERDANMWRFSEVPRDLLAALYKMAREEVGEKIAAEQCNTIAMFLYDASGALDIRMRTQFETGLIHGDWHGGNLLFRDGGLVAILDLEFAGDGCYLEDLSYGISNLCLRNTTDERGMEGRTDVVLSNYQRYRTLSYHELIALYYAVGIKQVTTVAYQIQQLGGQVANRGPGEWMSILAQQCAWLGRSAKAVRGI